MAETTTAVVGIDQSGRVVTAIAGALMARDRLELLKWVDDGLSVRRTTVEHVRKVLGKQWVDEPTEPEVAASVEGERHG